jgi:hypothetical protein
LSVLRQELANTGWPDGFELTIGNIYAPGALLVAGQLNRVGITSQVLPLEEARIDAFLETAQLHLVLVSWPTPKIRDQWAARVGEENVLDLYSIPISYLAAPDLTITFTPNGWPLPSR